MLIDNAGGESESNFREKKKGKAFQGSGCTSHCAETPQAPCSRRGEDLASLLSDKQ